MEFKEQGNKNSKAAICVRPNSPVLFDGTGVLRSKPRTHFLAKNYRDVDNWIVLLPMASPTFAAGQLIYYPAIKYVSFYFGLFPFCTVAVVI